MNITGTAKQLAALIVNNDAARFIISTGGGRPGHYLHAQWGDTLLTLCSTRDVSQPRAFASLDAALSAAQAISATAGRERDHTWTGEAHRLPPMPEITIEVL